MHQHQACPRWFLTGVLLLVGCLMTAGTLAAQTTPEKTLTNSMGMEFVLIPSGTFKMGSDTGDADERPVHQVTISKAFYMGKYEVTQGQWQGIMGNNPSASPLLDNAKFACTPPVRFCAGSLSAQTTRNPPPAIVTPLEMTHFAGVPSVSVSV